MGKETRGMRVVFRAGVGVPRAHSGNTFCLSLLFSLKGNNGAVLGRTL